MTPIGSRHFVGALAPFRANLVWVDDPVPAAAELLTDRLGRFQRMVGGGWQPACSLWAQTYFNTLLIPAMCLLADETGPCAIGGLTGTFCPASGKPLHFALWRVGAGRGADIGLFDTVDRHVAALIAELNAACRLSKQLFGESAARCVSWTVGEIARTDPTGARAVAALFAAHPGARALCLSSLNGAECKRRYCCLRDRLPDQTSCGAICPRASATARTATV